MRLALVLGGASSVWEDYAEARDVCDGREFDIVSACNDIGTKWQGRLDFWVSLHPDKLADWEKARRAAGWPDGWRTVAHRQGKRKVDLITRDWGGSSGLFAALAAREHGGATHAIMCGVPMTSTPHFFSTRDWRYATHHQRGWKNHIRDIRSFCRSMSGWSREQIGAPDRAWLGLVESESRDGEAAREAGEKGAASLGDVATKHGCRDAPRGRHREEARA
jgi:hypothetical protein